MTNHNRQIPKIDHWCLAKKENLLKILEDQKWKEKVEEIGKVLIETINNGNKILICGNGGSAAQAQHMAAEFVVRLQKWRQPLPMVALTTDTSILTAYPNDAGFEGVFARQVQALGKCDDALLVLTTSGNSPNLLHALHSARDLSMNTLACSGSQPAAIDPHCRLVLHTSGNDAAQVQEGHLLALHLICEIVEQYYLKHS